MPLPSLRDVGIPIPPKCPRHNDDDEDAVSSTTPTPMTMPCRRPRHRLNAMSAKRRENEEEGGSEAPRGSEIPTAALAMPIPYFKPIWIGRGAA